MLTTKKVRQFGARVLGKAQVAEEVKVQELKVLRFGSRVTGTKVVPGTNTPAPDSKPVAKVEQRALSVRGIQQMIQKNPATARNLFVEETNRAGGPRKGALALFKEHAIKREETALLEDVEAALRALENPVEETTEGEEDDGEE